jgi:TPP-dependent 2-oxoacid decarboxylase
LEKPRFGGTGGFFIHGKELSMGIIGADIVLKTLTEEGVDVIFGYPGANTLPLNDRLADSAIRHYLMRHEQGAAHAADGYARATGKVGVCLATSGPGATNLVTGIATAYRSTATSGGGTPSRKPISSESRCRSRSTASWCAT